MGDSAGGGLAAAVALLARDRSGPVVARQILLYSMLDDRNTTPDPEIVPFAGWSYDDNATGWGALLGNAVGGPEVSAYAAPARATDLAAYRRPTSRSANSTSSATKTSSTLGA
jgi:acetyl esterase/lipase